MLSNNRQTIIIQLHQHLQLTLPSIRIKSYFHEIIEVFITLLNLFFSFLFLIFESLSVESVISALMSELLERKPHHLCDISFKFIFQKGFEGKMIT